MSQSVKFSYSAVDEETGKEVVGIEFRQGLMNEDQVLAQENKALPALLDLIKDAQANA